MYTYKRYHLGIIWFIGRVWSFLYSYGINNQFKRISNRLYTAWVSKEFKKMGYNSVITKQTHLVGAKHISIGTNTNIGTRSVLTAWDTGPTGGSHAPEIVIGDHVSIGDDNHITAINKILIGNNVLTGKKVTITDNSHGQTEISQLTIPPLQRPLYSAGPVIIEDGVWIGDKVTILPNVTIGKNAIIGANAVVTKDIPANCVVAGIPAKVIKLIQ